MTRKHHSEKCNMAEKKLMVDQLRKYLLNSTKEQRDRDYEELKEWNEVGPDAKEYIEFLETLNK